VVRAHKRRQWRDRRRAGSVCQGARGFVTRREGGEEDLVVVELPEGADTLDEVRDSEVLVRPSRPKTDWMLKSVLCRMVAYICHVQVDPSVRW
jgi:hypothetical protein